MTHYTNDQATLPTPVGYTEIVGNGEGFTEFHSCANLNLDHVVIRASLYLGTDCVGSIHITNSIISPPYGTTFQAILPNSNGALIITIEDTTIRPDAGVVAGGAQTAQTQHAVTSCDGCHIILNRLDVSNTGGVCLCGNVDADQVWFHDAHQNFTGDAALSHTGGFFPAGGGSRLHVTRSRVEPSFNATSGAEYADGWKPCTAVFFTQGGSVADYEVDHNFIGSCGYDMAHEALVNGRVHDNVFASTGHFGIVHVNAGVTFAVWTGNTLGTIDGVSTGVVVPQP